LTHLVSDIAVRVSRVLF